MSAVQGTRYRPLDTLSSAGERPHESGPIAVHRITGITNRCCASAVLTDRLCADGAAVKA
jgi:hypothetical protein